MKSPSKVEEGFRLILEGLGIDTNDPHFEKTATRAAEAWYTELCSGLISPPPKITTFPAKSNQMIVLRDIPIKSLCAHHLLPFRGAAAIGYIPGNGKIVGLSKLSRIADYWSRRPQVQEELTEQIADDLARHVITNDAGGVGVVIRANHMCMELRGVGHSGDMVTSALRGNFNQESTRAEFLRLAGM